MRRARIEAPQRQDRVAFEPLPDEVDVQVEVDVRDAERVEVRGGALGGAGGAGVAGARREQERGGERRAREACAYCADAGVTAAVESGLARSPVIWS